MKTFSEGVQGNVKEYTDTESFAPENVSIGYIRHGKTRKEERADEVFRAFQK